MSPPWMPFYIADYLADTGHLSNAEHGSYLLLIFHYWQNGGLPNDDVRLARIARVSQKEWKTMRQTLSEFFSDDWKHDRIERELLASIARYERRANAGSLGGNAKAMRLKRGSNATAMLPHSHKQSGSKNPALLMTHAGDATTTTTVNPNPERELHREGLYPREASLTSDDWGDGDPGDRA